jgi:hypothetical protein
MENYYPDKRVLHALEKSSEHMVCVDLQELLLICNFQP